MYFLSAPCCSDSLPDIENVPATHALFRRLAAEGRALSARSVGAAGAAEAILSLCGGLGFQAEAELDIFGFLLLNFGGLGDEAEMRFLLSDLHKGEVSDTSALIPENATNVYYILSYLSLDQAKSVFDALRSCTSQSFNVCVRDVSEFIPENKREEYRASLSAFKTLLVENGIQFFSVMEGGEKNEE